MPPPAHELTGAVALEENTTALWLAAIGLLEAVPSVLVGDELLPPPQALINTATRAVAISFLFQMKK